LPKSISKIRFELSVQNKLHAILANNTEGASVIELAAIELFEYILKSDKADIKLFYDAANAVRSKFSAMANIISLYRFVKGNFQPPELRERIAAYKKALEIDRKNTIEICAKIIGKFDSIFTLSNSSTISQAILRAKEQGWNGKVSVVESRPIREGAILASQLAQAGIKTELGIDMILPDFVKLSQAMILGADAVTPTYFVNKIGTRIAIDYARTLKKPIYVVAVRSKIVSNREYKFDINIRPASEVTENHHPNLLILNRYFELVKPAGNFHYIVGHQVLQPKEIRNLLK
jgi:translation initiation factor 2B subunit (eIF-2B alpha/beta/delta family)